MKTGKKKCHIKPNFDLTVQHHHDDKHNILQYLMILEWHDMIYLLGCQQQKKIKSLDFIYLVGKLLKNVLIIVHSKYQNKAKIYLVFVAFFSDWLLQPDPKQSTNSQSSKTMQNNANKATVWVHSNMMTGNQTLLHQMWSRILFSCYWVPLLVTWKDRKNTHCVCDQF